MLLISDAAKEVKVENHVLRYWEEELELPIKRNEFGHRYYTEEDIDRFKRIRDLKNEGLQLKAIKTVLANGKDKQVPERLAKDENMVEPRASVELDKTEKGRKLQWIIKQLIREAVVENNEVLCGELKECVLKELDYQFRLQDERDDEREKLREKRNEEYYKKMDELMRKKSKKKRHFL